VAGDLPAAHEQARAIEAMRKIAMFQPRERRSFC
jgi:hypothetical protein